MKKEFLEAGKIINTFGIRGELKVQPWSDRVDFLKQFKIIYISGQSGLRPGAPAECSADAGGRD